MKWNCSICRKKSVTGLVHVTMVCPSRHALLSAREHLRFWSFVKEFHEESECRMSVTISVGKELCRKMWREYCEKAVEMMNLCLKQYDVRCEVSTKEVLDFDPIVDGSTFIRPDDFMESMYNLHNNN